MHSAGKPVNDGALPTSSDTGRLGESIAVEYLEAKGYSIVERRFKIRGGEIDIVAKKDGILTFVEVKTVDLRFRKQLPFGDPLTWVTPRKQKFMASAARHYLWKKSVTNLDIRFDVMIVRLLNDQNETDHLMDAFRP